MAVPDAVRRVFVLDVVCALGGAAAYVLLLDRVVEMTGLPRWAVQAQLAANVAYALYGVVLNASRTRRPVFFRFLAHANLAYAAACGVGALAAAWSPVHAGWGVALLVGEGAVVGSLAMAERRILRAWRGS